MLSPSLGRIMLFSLLAIVVMSPERMLSLGNHVPDGAKIIFEDDFSASSWKGALLEKGAVPGEPGMALVLVAYRDTVRIESEAAFTVEEESCLSFSFSASGYQHLRVLLWSEGESVPKGAFVTQFPSGEIQEVNIPIDGNFHNFHWRQGDYRAVRAGDRITRMAFEFTLADKASPKLAVGKITVYSLTPEVYRNRIREALAVARREVDNIPGSLAAGKKRLDDRLREMEEAFNKQSPNLNRPLKELLEKVESVADAAVRINLYYEPALRASGRSEIDYCVGSENSLRRVTGANKRLHFQGKVPAEPAVSLARGNTSPASW